MDETCFSKEDASEICHRISENDKIHGLVELPKMLRSGKGWLMNLLLGKAIRGLTLWGDRLEKNFIRELFAALRLNYIINVVRLHFTEMDHSLLCLIKEEWDQVPECFGLDRLILVTYRTTQSRRLFSRFEKKMKDKKEEILYLFVDREKKSWDEESEATQAALDQNKRVLLLIVCPKEECFRLHRDESQNPELVRDMRIYYKLPCRGILGEG